RLTQDLKRQDVLDKVQTAAATAGEIADELQGADVLPVNPKDDGVTSDIFTIKTLAQDQAAILDALLPEFADVTETEPALEFEGSGERLARNAPVYRIIDGTLGSDIDRPEYQDDV